jgi:hypothetical protein
VGRALYTPLKRVNDFFTDRGLPGFTPFLPDVDEKVGAGPQMAETEIDAIKKMDGPDQARPAKRSRLARRTSTPSTPS